MMPNRLLWQDMTASNAASVADTSMARNSFGSMGSMGSMGSIAASLEREAFMLGASPASAMGATPVESLQPDALAAAKTSVITPRRSRHFVAPRLLAAKQAAAAAAAVSATAAASATATATAPKPEGVRAPSPPSPMITSINRGGKLRRPRANSVQQRLRATLGAVDVDGLGAEQHDKDTMLATRALGARSGLRLQGAALLRCAVKTRAWHGAAALERSLQVVAPTVRPTTTPATADEDAITDDAADVPVAGAGCGAGAVMPTGRAGVAVPDSPRLSSTSAASELFSLPHHDALRRSLLHLNVLQTC